MKAKIIVLNVLVLSVLFLATNVFAYETYEISDSEFEAGYTQDLSPGDKITVNIDGTDYHITALSISQISVKISVSTLSDMQSFSIDENKKFEVTGDNYYDISITLNSVNWVSTQEKSASITIKKTNEEVPGGTDLPDSCPRYYTCPDGTKVIECEISGTGCLCKSNPASLCPREDEGDSCAQWYTCPDGSKVKKCEIASNGMCGCKSHPEDLCEDDEDETPTTSYFKSCSYVWDSSPYVNQIIKITASIKDATGNTDSDSVQVKVVEGNVGSGGSGQSMDGKMLDIQINEPRSEKVKAGAVEIKVSSKGPNELGEMSLGFSGDNWGMGFPISNRNCISGGSSSGGGSGSGSTCEKYYTCEDGSEVQYCEIVKQYDDNGNVVGAGCGCKSNPEKLCISSSSGGGGSDGKPTIEIPPSSSGGSGNNATPVICNGCILGNKCVPVGYRTEDKYCNIESELVGQLNAQESCNNNFECSTNLCIDGQCVSSNLWQRFLRWLSRLFG